MFDQVNPKIIASQVGGRCPPLHHLMFLCNVLGALALNRVECFVALNLRYGHLMHILFSNVGAIPFHNPV